MLLTNRNIIIIVTAWGGLYACGSPSSNPRDREQRQTAQDPIGEPVPESEDVLPPPVTPEDNDIIQDPVDESTLPDYILKKEDLEDLEPLVEPQVTLSTGGSNGFTQARNSSEISRFLAEIANKSMKLPALKPGRVFKTMVIADGTLNALMTADYLIGINSGVLLKADADEVLSVVCHEMAHGARNHPYKSIKATPDLVPSTLRRQIDQYLASQYNRNSETYTHRKTAYLELLEKWDKSAKKLGEYSKRQEAEADVVGASLCAYMGLKPEVFSKAIVSFLKKGQVKSGSSSFKSAKDLTDGQRLRVPPDVVMDILFPVDSHPTAEERGEQMVRLKNSLAIEKTSIDSSLYTSWNEAFEQQRETLRGASLSLTGLAQRTFDSSLNRDSGDTPPIEPLSFVVTDLTTGKALEFPKGPPCSHPWHRYPSENQSFP